MDMVCRLGTLLMRFPIGIMAFRQNQNRPHPHPVRHNQIFGDVFKHHRAFGIHRMTIDKALIGRGIGLGNKGRIDNIKHSLEMIFKPQLAGDIGGMARRTAGENQFAARQSRDG